MSAQRDIFEICLVLRFSWERVEGDFYFSRNDTVDACIREFESIKNFKTLGKKKEDTSEGDSICKSR